MNPVIFLDFSDLLADLYPDEASIRRVATDSGISLARLVWGSPVNNWHAILTEAEKTNRIRNIFSTVEKEYGDNPKFRVLYETYKAIPNGDLKPPIGPTLSPPDRQDPALDFLAQQIKEKKCIPIISNRVTNKFLFPQLDLVEAWAMELRYPFANRNNLPLVAQYQTVLTTERQAKFNYLKFLKKTLINQMSAANPGSAKVLQETIDRNTPPHLAHSLSNVYRLCGGPKLLKDVPENPWPVLVQMQLPVYVTTGYHSFLEEALREVGRKPQVVLYSWRDQTLETNDAKRFMLDHNDIKATLEEPLVFHLYGLDELSESLVLTEDNFFDFLSNISHDLAQPRPEKQGGIPDAVRRLLAFSSSSVLLLGYNLYDWDFRVAFRSAINSLRNKHKGEHPLLIQFDPELISAGNSAEVRKQVQEYLKKCESAYELSLYSESVGAFLHRLAQHLEK